MTLSILTSTQNPLFLFSSNMLRKFFIGNTAVLGASLIGYSIFMDKKNQNLYKSTRVFDLVMRTLRSHEGAVHFLGEPIIDGKLKVIEEKKEKDLTIYRVKVTVKGSKALGCMNFWLRRVGEEPDVDLTRIELQIQNIKNRLLVFQEDNIAETPKENAVS